MSIFDDPAVVPGMALDPRFAGLVRLAGLGYPGKRIETRPCATRHRGPVVICATTGASTLGKPRFRSCFELAKRDLVEGGLVPADVFDRETVRHGVAVAVATIDDVRPLRADDWPRALFDRDPSETRYAWPLSNIWPCQPFPVRVQQSLFFRVNVRDVVKRVGGWAVVHALPDQPNCYGKCQRCAMGTNQALTLFADRALCASCFGVELLRERDLLGLGEARWSKIDP